MKRMKEGGVFIWDLDGLGNAVRRLTFELEMKDKQGLHLEPAGTADARNKGRNKAEASNAGASQTSRWKGTEISSAEQVGISHLELYEGLNFISGRWEVTGGF